METNFSNILDKFKQGSNSMGQAYAELSYLSTNYDKEIEKLQKIIEDEKTKANNEEFLRHEMQNDLKDLKALQQINFSQIVDELIEKPREKFQNKIKESLNKFVSTIIFFTIISITFIVGVSFYLLKINNVQTPSSNNTEIKSMIMQLKKENLQLKNLIENKIVNISGPGNIPILKEIEKPIETQSEDKKEELHTENKDEIESKVLSILVNYDKRFKLNTKNDTRLLYKIYLLDIAPFDHDLIIQEIKLFAKKETYVPTKEDLIVWDKQVLHIYSKMLERIKDIPEAKITEELRSFNAYKFDDATLYTGWGYYGEDNLTTKESLKKEIEKLQSHNKLNK